MPEIFSDIENAPDAVFLPINGVGNNMNLEDAARFFKDLGANAAVPYHVGMFDDISREDFRAENKIILKVYEEREI